MKKIIGVGIVLASMLFVSGIIVFVVFFHDSTNDNVRLRSNTIVIPDLAKTANKALVSKEKANTLINRRFSPSRTTQKELSYATRIDSKKLIKDQEDIASRNTQVIVDEEIPEEIVFNPKGKNVIVQEKKASEVAKRINPNINKIPQPSIPLWKINAVKLSEEMPGPKIAIVIDDAGIDRKRTKFAINLTAPLTFSFLTYGSQIQKQVEVARQAGHEIMCHIPMQPIDPKVDPGPNVLSTDLTGEEIRRRLEWGLSNVTGIVGINNHMGSKFTNDVRGMSLVMEELRRYGLLFLDSRTTSQTVGAEVARLYQVPFAVRNVFLDHENDLKSIRKRLLELESIARKNGFAIAIGHPRPNTIKALSQWLPILPEKGFILAPVSDIARILDKVASSGTKRLSMR